MSVELSDRMFPVAKWVAALEVGIRSGDFGCAATAAEELRRIGVRVSVPGLGTLKVAIGDCDAVAEGGHDAAL